MITLAALSGGRDSTAATLKYLENGGNIDYILFSDTLEEFIMMYEYIDKVDKYLGSKYGKQIIRLKPTTTFEHWVFGKMTKGKNNGAVRGLPKKIDPCYWKRESKIKPVELFHKSINVTDGNYKTIIGYTASEKNRVQKDPNLIYPLIEWNWCEGDVDEYLKSINMVNPLYKYFSRTGCSFCPHMSLRGYYIVWKFFKKTWLYMKKIERKLRNIERLGLKVVNKQWHDRYTLLELEKDFISGKKDYDDTPAKDCVCAI